MLHNIVQYKYWTMNELQGTIGTGVLVEVLFIPVPRIILMIVGPTYLVLEYTVERTYGF